MRHDNNCRHNGNNGNTADNGSDNTAPVLGLLGLGRRNKRLRGLGRLGQRLLIMRLRRHMSRGTLRSALPRRSGRPPAHPLPETSQAPPGPQLRPRNRCSSCKTWSYRVSELRTWCNTSHLPSLVAAAMRPRSSSNSTVREKSHSCCATLPPRPKLCRFTTINRPDLSTLLYKKTKPQVNESVIIGKSRYGRGVPIHRSKPA